jgi:hypothetical protein
MTDKPLRKCFAFNGDGLRCMGIAGHDGPHAHAIEWTDDEVWTPEARDLARIPMGVADGLIPAFVPDVPVAGSGRCGICLHPHHPDGTCGADDGGFDCDCATSIED